MWYTSISGIYYPVYLESVNKGYIENIKIDTTLDSVTFDVKSLDLDIDVVITLDEEVVYEGKLNNKEEIWTEISFNSSNALSILDACFSFASTAF